MTSTDLERAAQDYLPIRRLFGYKLRGQDRLLADFCAWAQRAGLDTVTTEAAAWAVAPGAGESWHAERLSMIRGFANYLRVLDPVAKCRPDTRCPRAIGGCHRTSTRLTTSARSWRRPGSFPGRCGPPPLRPCSVSWPSRRR